MPLVAHLSDLHLLSLSGVNPLRLLNKRITGALNLLFNRGGQFPVEVARAALQDIKDQGVDHLIVSGDLSNLSLPGEFQLVRELLDGLDLPPDRITVVPGNHDCYIRSVLRSNHFGRTFEDYLRGDVQPLPGAYPLLKLQHGLAVVALSSARPSPALMAYGTLGEEQIRLAGQLLSHEACQGRFRVVVLHHPPGGPHVKWHNTLTDHQRFCAMLAETGADMVVHGHIHLFSQESILGPQDRPIPVKGVASGTWLSPHDPSRRAQYNLYQVEGQTLESVRRRRWDPEGRCFEDIEVN